MHQRIGFIVGAVTFSLSTLAGPVLATSPTLIPQGNEPAQARRSAFGSSDLPEQGRPLVAVSHRGAAGTAPENTLAAIDEGHRLGAESVEIDVRPTSDEELVLMHDATLERTTDVAEVFPDRAPYNVGDFTLEELGRLDAGSFFGPEFEGEPVPSLSEALDRLQEHDMNLLLEVKEPELYPGIERLIAAELKGRPHWMEPNAPDEPHRLLVQSFDWEYTERSKELLPSLPHGLLGLVPENEIDDYTWAQQINPAHTTIDADYVAAVQDAGLEIMPYTVNEADGMYRLLGMGVDGFITDFPGTGQRVIREFREGRARQVARESEGAQTDGCTGEGEETRVLTS
ncbi:glycerophosphodiester phosphodiesterase [Nocardiopsis alkaliphila]|uniref:glycerophosphodiester phosphodiesterase n=1 Tax=Nocardiopsis alkaliphila TaxID=225762 RepID=UPI00034DA312|nr:glycerophosphodiester phosphodiesterase family protein [Nocardiopsis alkaliphila]